MARKTQKNKNADTQPKTDGIYGVCSMESDSTWLNGIQRGFKRATASLSHIPYSITDEKKSGRACVCARPKTHVRRWWTKKASQSQKRAYRPNLYFVFRLFFIHKNRPIQSTRQADGFNHIMMIWLHLVRQKKHCVRILHMTRIW